MGDNSPPYVYQMEIWKTWNNVVFKEDHPTGHDDDRLFRPVMASYGSKSIIVAGSRTYDTDGTKKFMTEMFQYKWGPGWINRGAIEPSLDAAQQFGIYVLNDELAAYDSLNSCA